MLETRITHADTTGPHSRNRASILAAYTVYISRSLVNFDETTLEPVTTALLIDLAALKKTALIAPALSPAKTAPTAGQKAKSKQRLDDGLELNDTRPLNIDANVVDAAELACEGACDRMGWVFLFSLERL